MSIYADALGADWNILPEPVRALHAGGGKGTFRVTRRGLARLIPGLPRAGESVPIDLTVVRRGDTERWTRTFAGHQVVASVQRLRGNVIDERIGVVSVRMSLVAAPGALRYRVLRIRFLGIPIPLRLLPSISASEAGEGDAVRVDIRVGRMFGYEGTIRPGLPTGRL